MAHRGAWRQMKLSAVGFCNAFGEPARLSGMLRCGQGSPQRLGLSPGSRPRAGGAGRARVIV